MAGPLQGLKIVEMVGMGPGPFCAMMLADMGAEVIRVDRLRPNAGSSNHHESVPNDILGRGRRSLAIDLRKPEAVATVLQLIDNADALIEGFRPGVMERMGLGPDVCMARNARLVYGRMTGWGQYGPLAQAAGHDINYIAITGALHAIGEPGRAPVVPLNLVGDFGGGAMFLAFGLMCALHHVKNTGVGQVVDAAMTDGASLLSSMMYGFKAAGQWNNRRGENLLDGGAHFYQCYGCADGKFVALGAIEPQFYATLLKLAAIDDPDFTAQMDPRAWPVLKERLQAVFKTKTRAQWCELMEGTDVCFAPVLDWDEAPEHPHNRARQTFVDIEGVMHPAPAPRFSKTPADTPKAAAVTGAHSMDVLRDWGISDQSINRLSEIGAI